MNEHFFPGFEYAAEELCTYMLCVDVFIISLAGGGIVHYHAPCAGSFAAWLGAMGVRDITATTPADRADRHPLLEKKEGSAGSMVMEYYKGK